MRTGIYLGPVSTRVPRIAVVLVVVLFAGTLVHLAAYLRQRTEVERTRSEVERVRSEAARRESVVSTPVASMEDGDVAARLRAASISGVALLPDPTELVRLVQEALPEGVALGALTLDLSSTRPGMVLDAMARGDRDVTTLQQRLVASPPVVATEVLEERVGPDGMLAIRLQVSLGGRGDRSPETIQ